MGVEASFQAMPENCDLFITARQDREIAEWITAFHFSTAEISRHFPDDQKWVEFYSKAQNVVAEFPGIRDRYFYAGNRTFDAIVYLLSPIRRSTTHQKDTSLIHQAIYGQELLHPEACATQGRPIGLVPAIGVLMIAEYLSQISRDILYEHYNPKHMCEVSVYKMPCASQERFEDIWEEFVGMRDVYQAAADHNEAVITVID